MKRFNSRIEVPVDPTFRLDFTTEALRRLAANVVDVIDADGTYHRAIQGRRGTVGLAVRLLQPGRLELRATARDAKLFVPLIERILGTHADLRGWNERAAKFPWLARLADAFTGLRPPRYPSLWEALGHAIVFQQISIHAAGAIMRRTVEALSPSVDIDGVALRPFPTARQFIEAGESRLRSCGLSANKAAHLLACARALEDGVVSDELIEGLPTDDAIQALTGLRGIGRWSASVVMLRGFGRLDTFPLGDSGVARALRELSGDPAIDETKLLHALGPVRGMLYFHLLLGRLRNRAIEEGDR
jgi:DNA-3-methyladenine glycosylase II